MSKRILLVEDEPSLAMVVQDSLQRKGYQIDHALDGVEALNLFPLKDYQLVILDVMLPHVDGLSVAKEIREKSAEIPILFLTAKSTKEDLIQGYQAGGNDYLRKPFHLEELFFRVQELLGRKIEDTETGVLAIGTYQFNTMRQELVFNSKITRLSHREAQLLVRLYEHRGTVLDRRQILLKIWGHEDFFSSRNLDVYISKLRRKLEQDSQIQILNIRGFGYKLVVE